MTSIAFLPTTREEMRKLGWKQLDIILVSGDSYIDSPFMGVAVIGKYLVSKGFRVGIIAQPNVSSPLDITRLGEPVLYWGVSGGSIDSMVANYTATLKKRRQDDYTPGGQNNRRPDRALIAYTNLIQRYFKRTVPIVLGGIEASLRRLCHYDMWSNKIRRSILLDSKADYLVYGMGEKSALGLSQALAKGNEPFDVAGICYLAKSPTKDGIYLPSFEACSTDNASFIDTYHSFYKNNDPRTGLTLIQQYGDRYLIHNPPQKPLTANEIDDIHDLYFTRDQHPFYEKTGKVRALDTIRFAISTHRGCYGECNFCAIAVHQGREIQSRSEASIVKEAEGFKKHPLFKGIIADVGGPTANMYGYECSKKKKKGSCKDKRCLFPSSCSTLQIDHGRQISLLQTLRQLPHVKKVFVASGVRYDLILKDKKNGRRYLQELIRHHISGQMKIAPEHCNPKVLRAMGKPSLDTLREFRELFEKIVKKENKKLFLTYYMIAAHPGCSTNEMKELLHFCQRELKIIPRQVQVFTPTPSTFSTLMYWTEQNPWTGAKCHVEKNVKQREAQKKILTDQLKNRDKKQHYSRKRKPRKR